MERVVDVQGAQLEAILSAADFAGKRVLEVGCGDGRLTWGIAREAHSVLAFDPDPDSVARARANCPDELRDTVQFRVASAAEVDIEPQTVDLVFFSWSL